MCVPLLNKLNLISVLRIRMDPKKITLISDPDPYFFFKFYFAYEMKKMEKSFNVYFIEMSQGPDPH